MNFKMPSFLNPIFQEEKKEYVCLDAGTGYIKSIYIADGDIKKFLVHKRENSAIKIFSKWLRKEGLSAKKVKVAIKGNNTLLRYTPFPRVDKKNLKEVFGYEVAKYIPFKAEDVYFDTAILDDNYSDKEFFLLVAVAKKSFVDSLISELQQEKINVDTITLNNIALINLYLNSKNTESSTATLDIGASSSLLNLFKKGVPSLSREIKVSGNELLKKIAKAKNVSREEAEHIIDNFGKGEEPAGAGEIIDIIEDVGLELSEEIKNSLDYFEVNSGERIQKILTTGAVSKIKRITKIVSSSLGVNVELWNPLAYISYNGVNKDLEDYKEFLSVALGMSL